MFGMGTGVSSSLGPPEKSDFQRTCHLEGDSQLNRVYDNRIRKVCENSINGQAKRPISTG